jgi:Tfp pilus assembly protein PilN
MVELIPKETPKLAGWLNILFYLALALLIFAIASLFILNNSIKKSKATLEELILETLTKGKAPERVALKKEILNYEKKFEDFSVLINQHLENSKFFTAFQKISHPQVWFSQLNLNSEEKVANFSGEAKSFESLGQQLLILKNEDWIKNVELKEVSINKEGKINFNLSFSFNLEILK